MPDVSGVLEGFEHLSVGCAAILGIIIGIADSIRGLPRRRRGTYDAANGLLARRTACKAFRYVRQRVIYSYEVEVQTDPRCRGETLMEVVGVTCSHAIVEFQERSLDAKVIWGDMVDTLVLPIHECVNSLEFRLFDSGTRTLRQG